MRKLLVIATLAVAVTAAGCTSMLQKHFAEPVVSFKDVKVNGLGLSGGSVDIILSVYNPNGYSLDATRFTYNLTVDTIPFGSGQTDQKWTVNEKDSTTVRLPLSFTYAGIGAAGRQLLNTGSVNYTVSGDVTVATPIGNFTRPYRQTGRFNSLSGTSR